MPNATVHPHPRMGTESESTNTAKKKTNSRFGFGVVVGLVGGVGLAYGVYSFAESMVERRTKRLAEQARTHTMLVGGTTPPRPDDELPALEVLE